MKLNKKIIKSFTTVILAFAMIFCCGFSNSSQALTTYYTLHFVGNGPICGHDVDAFGIDVQFNRNLLTKYNRVRKTKTKTTLYANNWTKKGTYAKGIEVVVGNTKKYKNVSYTQVQVPLKNTSYGHTVYTISNKFAKTNIYTGWVKTKDLQDLSGSQYIIGRAWYGKPYYSTKRSQLYKAVLENEVTRLHMSYFKDKYALFLK